MANNTPQIQGAPYNFLHTTNYAKGALVVTPFGYRGGPPPFKGPIPFMLNPESITETLQGGWVHKQVPGQNDPVSSWVGNGVRTVNLTLLLIKDLSAQPKPIQPSANNPSFSTVLGNLAASVARVPMTILQNLSNKEPANTIGSITQPADLSIASELDQLRQLRYGELYKKGLYSTPPSLVKFQFDGLNVPDLPNVSNPSLGVNTNALGNVYWTVDTMEIVITKWSSTLQPLEAEVKMTLVQFNDINRSRVLTAGSNAGTQGSIPIGTPVA